jgi:hypothetical protein
MGPGEIAWDLDRHNPPSGEELTALLIYVPGEEQPIDAGTQCGAIGRRRPHGQRADRSHRPRAIGAVARS